MVERAAFEKDPFWTDWAQSLITAGVTWMLADCPPEQRKISVLFDIFHADDVSYKLACMLDKKEVKHRAACSVFAAFLQLPDSTTRPQRSRHRPVTASPVRQRPHPQGNGHYQH
jgi:type IV secretory pathway TraG/TraD family ATPase VirD4